MKTKELHQMSVEDLKILLKEEKEAYQKLLLASKISTVENPIKKRLLRRNIARLHTIIHQKSKA